MRRFLTLQGASVGGWLALLCSLAACGGGSIARSSAVVKEITASRLQRSFTRLFVSATFLQQRELGRTVAPGAHLNIAHASCVRHGTGRNGPGDWTCSIQIIIPTAGSTPQPVTYDISVQSNGCYTARSPPAFVGSQTITDKNGNQVVNPLYTIHGCVNKP